MSRETLVVLLLLLASSEGCKRRERLPSNDAVAVDDAGIAEPGIGAGPEVPFRIEAIHREQRLLQAAPWHEPGGTWTFFDAKTTDGYRFGFGFDATKAAGSMSFGKVILTVPTRDDGKRLVDLFARRFEAKAPPEVAPQPLVFRPVSAVFLASDARRTSGGFAGKGGGYFATKLFLQRPGIEAEVFFNFSLTAKQGQFSEKDHDYARDLVAFLASELRDGKAPRPTAATHPSMTDKGPRLVMGRTLPGRPAGFTPERDRYLAKEPIDGGGMKLVSHALGKDDASEVFRVPGDLGSFRCAPTRCVLESVTHAERGVESSEDPRTLMIADRKTRAVTKLDGPWSKKASVGLGTSISPDGELVLVEDLVDNPGGKTPLKHVLYVVDRAGAAKGPIDLGAGWQAVAIEPASKGSKILVRKGYSWEKASISYVVVDPKTGAVTPASAPASSASDDDERFLSPDGKRRIACREDAIVITELATQKETRFAVFDGDRKAIEARCVEWASDRYILYQSDWTGLLDTETMKISELAVPGIEEGRLRFDRRFENVVHEQGGTARVGRVELPAK